MERSKGNIPTVQSRLRHGILRMPETAYQASGIVINGRRIKSLVFTTDLAIIRNCDADAVFAGVGGGTTKGLRTIGLAKDAEGQGAMGVVLNSPVTDLNLAAVAAAVDIPVIITVTSPKTDITRRLTAGAQILNIACGEETASVVEAIHAAHPDVPIIASGGPTEETVRRTIEAGANAVTITPPSTKELFRGLMERYRETGGAEE